MRRRGQASIIGSILFFVLFAAAMAGVAYYASSQSQANGAANGAQTLMAQKGSEQLTYGALSNGSLTIQDTGGESVTVVEVVIKYSNGTVYTASPSTSTMASNSLLQVGKLIPSSLQSRYSAILSSTNPADEIGVVTSRGNTFWLKPAVAAQTNPNLTYGVTFDASGTGSFGTTPVVTVDGVGYAASQLPVTLSWFAGTKHTYSYTTSLPLGTGSRVGVGSVQGISTSPSGTLTATSTGTVRAGYSTQYQLAVSGGNAVAFIGSPTNDGWYDSGSIGQFTCNYVWNIVSGSRSDLVSYSLDGSSPASVTRSGTGTYTSIGVTMTSPHTITLTPTTQYQLTVSGGNGIGYSLASQTNDGWYDSASSLTVLSNYVWSQVAGQSRQNLLSYTLDGTTTSPSRSSSGAYATPPITMNAAHALTFNPVTQYYLTISGGTSTAMLGSQTNDGWFDSGSGAQAQSGYCWGTVAGQSRSNLYSYTIDSGSPTTISSRAGSGSYTTPPITMNAYHSLTFEPITQYFLTVNGGTSLVYTTSPTADGWYDAGTPAQVTTDYVWNIVPGQSRQDLTSWNVDGGANNDVARSGSGSVTVTATATMTTYHTVNFNGVTQYTLSANGGNSVSYSGSITSDGWYDSGSTATATTNYVWSVVAGQSRLNLASWNLDGGANQAVTRAGSGTFTTTSLTMNAFHKVNFNSVTQYYVTVANSVPTSGSVGALTVSYSYRTPPTTVSQFLSNPGFESGSLGGWTSWTSYNEVVTSPVHSGSYAAGLSSDGSTGGIISQDISLPSGSQVSSVYMSMWYYIPTSDPSDVTARMYPQFCSSAQPSGTTKGAWTQLTFSWSGSCSTTAGEPWFIGGDASAGVFSYVDDTTVSYTYTYPLSGSTPSSSNSYSVSGDKVTYSYGVGYSFPGGTSSDSWSATWPSPESYSSNNCSGGSISSNTISGTGSSCTLTTTYSGSYSASIGASQTGDGWYDSGTSGVSIIASGGGPFGFGSWSAPSGITVASPSSASTTVTMDNYGTVTASFSVNQ